MESPPPFFPIFALQEVLIQFDELSVVILKEFRESFLGIVENVVVMPVSR